MRTFIINSDDSVRAVHKADATEMTDGVIRFDSEKQWQELAAQWPLARLANICNGITGVSPVRKFTNRQVAADRIWKGIQNLAPAKEQPRMRKKAAGATKAQAASAPEQE